MSGLDAVGQRLMDRITAHPSAGAAGVGVFFSDVGEMLMLFAACIFFVVAMLAYERSAKDTSAQSPNDET